MCTHVVWWLSWMYMLTNAEWWQRQFEFGLEGPVVHQSHCVLSLPASAGLVTTSEGRAQLSAGSAVAVLHLLALPVRVLSTGLLAAAAASGLAGACKSVSSTWSTKAAKPAQQPATRVLVHKEGTCTSTQVQ